MGRTLWELDEALEALVDRYVDPETGELAEGFEDAFEALEVERERKILAVARYAQARRAIGEMRLAESRRIRKRSDADLAAVDRIKALLLESLEPGEKYEDEVIRVRTQRNPVDSVVFPQGDARGDLTEEQREDLAEEWAQDPRWRDFVRIDYDLRIKPLVEAIQDGEVVPEGLKLERRRHVRIE